MGRTGVIVILLLASVAALTGCVEPRASLGNISLRPYDGPNQTVRSFGVQEGRLVSGSVDVAIDPDGATCGLAMATRLIPVSESTRCLADGERHVLVSEGDVTA